MTCKCLRVHFVCTLSCCLSLFQACSPIRTSKTMAATLICLSVCFFSKLLLFVTELSLKGRLISFDFAVKYFLEMVVCLQCFQFWCSFWDVRLRVGAKLRWFAQGSCQFTFGDLLPQPPIDPSVGYFECGPLRLCALPAYAAQGNHRRTATGM